MKIDRYQTYKDSEIKWLSEVPKHWQVVRAKDICQIFVPQRDKPDLNEEKGTPWITSDLLGNAKIGSEKLKYLVDEEEIKYKRIRKVPINSVLASCIGEFSLTAINQFAVVINQQIQAYSYIKKQSSEFINYQIQANVTRLYYETVATETTIKYINKEKFSFTPLYLPPLPEQKAIAHYLDTKTAQIDRKIDLLTQKATQYGNLKQSLINEAVTRGLDRSVVMKDSGIEWIGDVPEHWEITAVTSITTTISIKNHPDEELLSVYRDYGVIIKSTRDDNHNRAGENLAGYKLVEPGYLVINKMKAWQGSLGVSEFRGIVSPAYITCKTDKRIIERSYLHHLLRCRNYINEYNRLSYGVRVDQWDMRYDDFKYVPVLLPPLSEQKAIADYLDTKTTQIDQIIQTINTQIEKLKELRKTLINDVVTGKIRVIDNGKLIIINYERKYC